MCTRNTSLTEKAWKVRQEVFMLLFTNYFEKTGWSYLEIIMWIITFFFFFTLHSELEKELSLHYTLLFGKFKDGCVYASYKSEWSIGAMDLYHHARYF